jgi:hypothetical protein
MSSNVSLCGEGISAPLTEDLKNIRWRSISGRKSTIESAAMFNAHDTREKCEEHFEDSVMCRSLTTLDAELCYPTPQTLTNHVQLERARLAHVIACQQRVLFCQLRMGGNLDPKFKVQKPQEFAIQSANALVQYGCVQGALPTRGVRERRPCHNQVATLLFYLDCSVKRVAANKNDITHVMTG